MVLTNAMHGTTIFSLIVYILSIGSIIMNRVLFRRFKAFIFLFFVRLAYLGCLLFREVWASSFDQDALIIEESSTIICDVVHILMTLAMNADPYIMMGLVIHHAILLEQTEIRLLSLIPVILGAFNLYVAFAQVIVTEIQSITCYRLIDYGLGEKTMIIAHLLTRLVNVYSISFGFKKRGLPDGMQLAVSLCIIFEETFALLEETIFFFWRESPHLDSELFSFMGFLSLCKALLGAASFMTFFVFHACCNESIEGYSRYLTASDTVEVVVNDRVNSDDPDQPGCN